MLRSHLSHVHRSVPNLRKIFHASLPFPPTFPSTPTPPATARLPFSGHLPFTAVCTFSLLRLSCTLTQRTVNISLCKPFFSVKVSYTVRMKSDWENMKFIKRECHLQQQVICHPSSVRSSKDFVIATRHWMGDISLAVPNDTPFLWLKVRNTRYYNKKL